MYEQKFVMDQLCQENLLLLQVCRNTIEVWIQKLQLQHSKIDIFFPL